MTRLWPGGGPPAPGSLPRLLLLAVAVRLLLLPLSHTWDGQSWLNVLAELARPGTVGDAINRPYESFRELSLLAQAAGRQQDYYEYWAYPPLMLYVYWPLAQAYRLIAGLPAPAFAVQPAFVTPVIPLGALLVVRLPVIVADIAILCLMRALGVSLPELRWYAFNPLVLLVGIWTFDSVAVTFLLAALAMAERKHWTSSGTILALGAATKFFPLVVLPSVFLAIATCPHPISARLRSLVSTALAAVLTIALLTWPVRDGVAYALRFHAERFAAGLTFEQGWRAWAQHFPTVDWQPAWYLYASADLGALTLPLTLVGAGFLLTLRPVPLRRGFLILTVTFLIGSKVVNEPYTLAPVALITAELARNSSRGLRICRTLLWMTAFLYAALNTPLFAFGFSALQQISPNSVSDIRTWAEAYRLFRGTAEAAVPYAVLGATFSAILVVTGWVAWRPHAVPARLGSRLVLPSRPLRCLAVLMGAAVVCWLGYSAGRLQSLEAMSRLERDVDTDRYSLSRGAVVVHFERLGGAGKPYIRSADGAELLDVSDWDRASRVVVDDTPYELVRVYPRSAVDYGRARIAETLEGDGWMLEREVTLEDNGTVHLVHTFVARRSIQHVALALAFQHPHFDELTIDGASLTGTFGVSRQQVQADAGPNLVPTYRVQVEALGEMAALRFRVGQETAAGTSSFVIDSTLDHPPNDRRAPLGDIIVHIQRSG